MFLKYKAEWYGRAFVKIDRFFSSSKLYYRYGYKKEDLTLDERMWSRSSCGTTHYRDVNASVNLYFVGLGRPEVKTVEHALVANRSHHATKQEAQPSNSEQSAYVI